MHSIELYCNALYCTVLHCIALYCTALYCTVLYCTVLYYTVLYCTALYCTVLYCTALHCTVLYCTVLYCTVLYCTVLYCTVLYCTVLYCTALHCTVLYCTVLYCTVLYCTVLYCTVLYCTVLHFTIMFRAAQHLSFLLFDSLYYDNFSARIAELLKIKEIRAPFFVFNDFLHRVENMPSVQSLVAASNRPNICGAVIAFGFILISRCGWPVSPMAFISMLIQAVLPAPLGPNAIMPCRTLCVSNNCWKLMEGVTRKKKY